MSKFSVGLIVSVVVVGNVITSTLLLRDSGPVGGLPSVDDWGAAAAVQREAIDSLRKDMGRLSVAVASILSSSTVTIDPAQAEGVNLAARFDEVIKRLEALEKSIAAKNEASDELAALKLRDKLQEQYRAEDGFAIAEELLAQGKFAAGGERHSDVSRIASGSPRHARPHEKGAKRVPTIGQLGQGAPVTWRDHEEVPRASRRGSPLARDTRETNEEI